jgi:rhodanese-related sulfurtransferase
MIVPWAGLGTHQRLASLAAILGFLAVFAGSPYTSDIDRIASDAAAGATRVEPLALAAEIRAQNGLVVVDVRDSAAYEEFHIPSAVHMPTGSLPHAGFSSSDRIALYGFDAADATAAWLVLRAAGVREVAIVTGNIDGWLFDVMEPWLPADATGAERAAFEETAAIARYFGGRVRRNVDPVRVAARRRESTAEAAGVRRAETLKRVRRSCGVR